MILSKFRIISMFALVLLFSAHLAHANSVGFNYNQAVGDVSTGIHGDYEIDFGLIDAEIEGQLQSGDVYLGNIDAAITFDFTFDIMSIGLRLASDNTLKGYSIENLGRDNVITGSIVVPILEKYEVSVGVFGRDGNPFVSVFELEDESNPDSLIVEKDAGISMPDDSRIGVSITVGFDVSRFEVDFKALLDPLSKVKNHQISVGIGTGGELFGSLGWIIKSDIVGQIIGGNGEFGISTIAGIDYNF